MAIDVGDPHGTARANPEGRLASGDELPLQEKAEARALHKTSSSGEHWRRGKAIGHNLELVLRKHASPLGPGTSVSPILFHAEARRVEVCGQRFQGSLYPVLHRLFRVPGGGEGDEDPHL